LVSSDYALCLNFPKRDIMPASTLFSTGDFVCFPPFWLATNAPEVYNLSLNLVPLMAGAGGRPLLFLPVFFLFMLYDVGGLDLRPSA